jgi:hypothetical protein
VSCSAGKKFARHQGQVFAQGKAMRQPFVRIGERYAARMLRGSLHQAQRADQVWLQRVGQPPAAQFVLNFIGQGQWIGLHGDGLFGLVCRSGRQAQAGDFI